MHKKSRLQNHRHNENAQIIEFLTNLVIVKHIKNVRTLLYACLLTVRVIKNIKHYYVSSSK